jgi:hypothetical protein
VKKGASKPNDGVRQEAETQDGPRRADVERRHQPATQPHQQPDCRPDARLQHRVLVGLAGSNAQRRDDLQRALGQQRQRDQLQQQPARRGRGEQEREPDDGQHDNSRMLPRVNVRTRLDRSRKAHGGA